jgi:hypothetical protein
MKETKATSTEENGHEHKGKKKGDNEDRSNGYEGRKQASERWFPCL